MSLSPTSSRGSGASATVQLLGSQVLTGAQATFDTDTILGTSISSLYSNLRVVVQLRGDTAAANVGSALRFNADNTGTNYGYAQQWWSNAASGANSTTIVPDVFANTTPAASAAAGLFSSATIDIYAYAGTTAVKTFTVLATGFATRLFILHTAGSWQTTAINRIQMVPLAGNWAAGSAFYLYASS